MRRISDLIAAHDRWTTLIIFLAAFVLFRVGPVRTVSDSKYSLAFAQRVLTHGEFGYPLAVDGSDGKSAAERLLTNEMTYRVERVGDRVFYFFPPGNVVLPLPYVAIGNLFGLSAVNSDGSYNLGGETRLQADLASLLMAGLIVLVLRTSLLFLPMSWSMVVAVAAACGTQVWSIASRALWSQTWLIFFLGAAVWMLARGSVKGTTIRPGLLASCLAWAYFVRPTASVPILAVACFVFVWHRRSFLPFALTGALWFGVLILYSSSVLAKPMPDYYAASRINVSRFGEAVAGLLISPSRGLLIFTPLIIFVGYLLVSCRATQPYRRLVGLGLAVCLGHFLLISSYVPWHGGHGFGPRLLLDLVPWFALLGILGLRAWLDVAPDRGRTRWRIEFALGLLLLTLSLGINAMGALSTRPWRWNYEPRDIDYHTERLWDWSDPQFLAKFRRRD